MKTIIVSVNENHHDSEDSLEDLINDGEISMNEVIPNGSGDHLRSVYKPKSRLEETGVHPIYKGHGLKGLENYQIRREQNRDQYSSE